MLVEVKVTKRTGGTDKESSIDVELGVRVVKLISQRHIGIHKIKFV